jgi:glycyl-tRNA synthetase beta chain
MTTANLFLELGTEELPAGAAPVAAEALLTKLVELLDTAGIAHGEATWLGTPRRMLAHVAAVALAQPDREVVATGPAWKVAKTDDGQWSKAAEAFAKSQNVALDALESVDTAKGAYIAARKQVIGRPTADLVAEALPGIFRGLPIPKRMRWATEKEAFLRPVHWLVALLGDEVLPVAFAGVQSGQTSMGHRFLANRPVQASSDLAQYQQRLMDAFVLADPAQRRKVIERGLGQLAAEAGGVWRRDDATLDTVVWLTEWPAPLLGNFDPAFLAIPPEVIFTTLRENQKLFLLEKPDGSLLPNFLGVANTLQEASRQTIADGNRRVVSARLSDAKFFYQEDVKQTLFSRLDDLDSRIYLQGLGSVGDKVRRLAELATHLAARLCPEETRDVERAAQLCKADLTTKMVFEFPELQGVIGRYYARHDGEAETVATAVAEHYQPRFAADDLPSTAVGRVLALADKTDTIVGCFALGLIPSGTQDPYALRRMALGVLRMLADTSALGLSELIDLAIGRLPVALQDKLGTAGREQILTFLRGRLQHLHSATFAGDLVEAVLEAGTEQLATVLPRLQALDALRQSDGWAPLAAALKRVSNLVKKSGAEVPAGTVLEPALLTTGAEQALFTAVSSAASEVDRLVTRGEWLEALQRMATIKPEVDAFFDGVMVLVDDVAVRRNRLALLQQTAGLFAPIADFARIAA